MKSILIFSLVSCLPKMIPEIPAVSTYEGCLQCLEICHSTLTQFTIQCDNDPSPQCTEQQCLYAQSCVDVCTSLSCDASLGPPCLNASPVDPVPSEPITDPVPTEPIPIATTTPTASSLSPIPTNAFPLDMNLCGKGLWTPSSMIVSPHPLIPSQKANFTLAGILQEEILETSTLFVQATVASVAIGYPIDLCTSVRNSGSNCPIDVGNQTMTWSIDVPSSIPKGEIPFRVEALNQDGVVIICFQTRVLVV